MANAIALTNDISWIDEDSCRYEPNPVGASVATFDDCISYGMVLQSERNDRAALTGSGDQTSHVCTTERVLDTCTLFPHLCLGVDACMVIELRSPFDK